MGRAKLSFHKSLGRAHAEANQKPFATFWSAMFSCLISRTTSLSTKPAVSLKFQSGTQPFRVRRRRTNSLSAFCHTLTVGNLNGELDPAAVLALLPATLTQLLFDFTSSLCRPISLITGPIDFSIQLNVFHWCVHAGQLRVELLVHHVDLIAHRDNVAYLDSIMPHSFIWPVSVSVNFKLSSVIFAWSSVFYIHKSMLRISSGHSCSRLVLRNRRSRLSSSSEASLLSFLGSPYHPLPG